MVKSYFRLSLPDDLCKYYVTEAVNQDKENSERQLNQGSYVTQANKRGISSIRYYSPDQESYREVFYKGCSIQKIDVYRNNKLYITEEYEDDLISKKEHYSPVPYIVEYKYNRKKLVTSVHKKLPDKNISAEFKYDTLDRIIERIICKNEKEVYKQSYSYDILDRIIRYQDNNQTISVEQISKNNELISYKITDSIGNNISVKNYFTITGYDYTVFTLNGHTTPVKNNSYVDNIMLKKPYATEDDLDLIIAGLFRDNNRIPPVKRDGFSGKASDLIDDNIKMRVLPISMRKRLMYNIALHS